MKYKIIFLLLLSSCVGNGYNNKNTFTYTAKGFAHINDQYIKKFDDNIFFVNHNKLKFGTKIQISNPVNKIFIVAIVWALLIVFLPIIDNYDNIDVIVLIYFIQIFIYVFVAILPFDIRDINLDIKILNTVPQNIGIKSTKTLGLVLLFVFVLLDFLQLLLLENVNLLSVLINIVICIALSILLYKSRENQTKNYASFWVESIPIFWLLLNLVL